MKPLKVTIQAFGSYYKKTVIDLTRPAQNLFLISGDTGSGKTTIFDAIVYALYGEASSGSSDRAGTSLQTQFGDAYLEPYVELIFSEAAGGEDEIYTVRRVPKHQEPKLRGSGMKEVGSSVSLELPDGMAHPGKEKEINGKIEELVGLSKAQFMQVAMIAQGEFMELLRAKSQDKKVIFRKLFGTEIYQKLTDELLARKKDKEAEMGRIRTVCQTAAARIRVPEDYAEKETISFYMKQIAGAASLSISDMEGLIGELEKLCAYMEEQALAAVKASKAADQAHGTLLVEMEAARNLDRRYAELHQAKQILASCQERQAEMEGKRQLAAQIQAAYEIKVVYERLKDALEAEKKNRENLADQEALYPALEAAFEAAAQKEKEVSEQAEQVAAFYATVAEKVRRNLEIFKEISRLEAELSEAEKNAKTTEDQALKAKKAEADFEQMEAEWKKKSRKLEGCRAELALWQGKADQAKTMSEDIQHLRLVEKRLKSSEKTAREAANAYVKAKMDYEQKKQAYDETQTIYLDAQAGYLAQHSLFEGQPCPVCGSLHHPSPCRLEDAHREITRERLDEMGKEVADLLGLMEKAAGKSGKTGEEYTQNQKQFDEGMDTLRKKIAEAVPGQYQKPEDPDRSADESSPGSMTLSDAERIIQARKYEIHEKIGYYDKAAREYDDLSRKLESADAQRMDLKSRRENAEAALTAAKEKESGIRSSLEQSVSGKEYESKETAQTAQRQAEEGNRKAQSALKEAKEAAKEAATQAQKSETLIRTYKAAAPELSAKTCQRQEEYSAFLSEKDMDDAFWKEICMSHRQKDIQILNKAVDDFRNEKIRAEAMEKSAKEAIGDQTKPDLEALSEKLADAEQLKTQTAQKKETVLGEKQNDTEVFATLTGQMTERGKVVAEHGRLERLYKVLSGKATGARMDIETYVQRYYLDRILKAANLRFEKMSLGQFELRMVPISEAGMGSNRGLDLEVYHHVTGKTRSVGTLSGGESFMAALAMALGMADQIQAGSAAINLDMMFIDEGFGSLDEHSRNQAVKVLKQMADGNRLIGIISHVTELKQEIEDQLLVTKDDTGSHIEWKMS